MDNFKAFLTIDRMTLPKPEPGKKEAKTILKKMQSTSRYE